MAKWFDKLKTFVEIDLSNFRSISFKLFHGNTNSPFIQIGKAENRTVNVTINVASAEVADDPEKRKLLLEAVRDAALEDPSKPLLESGAKDTLNDINVKKDDYTDTLEYFSDKIPQKDIVILKAALYIKSVHEEGGSVEALKADISEKYGRRGCNIVNLCTAGYFDSHLRPMYEEMSSRPDFAISSYINRYEKIVEGLPFAVFVGRKKSLEELKKEVNQKIEFNLKYGLKKINIHAIGEENIRKIKALLDDKEVSTKFSSSPDLSQRGNIFDVTIHL